MSTYTGTLQSGAAYPVSSGINVGAYDARALILWPYGATIAAGLKGNGARTLRIPPHLAIAHNGSKQRGFVDDWYERIHITPSAITLGVFVNRVSESVRVWNAHLSASQILESISGTQTTGIDFSGPSLPTEYRPNSSQTYKFTVSTIGPATVSSVYTYLFASGEYTSLGISGIRVVAWTSSPDWSNVVTEKLEWKTDILRTWSGAEQRRALRISPRRSFQYTSTVSDQERKLAETRLFAWTSHEWALPIWPDGQYLSVAISQGAGTISCKTANRDFVDGGLAIVMTSAAAYEIVQVTTVSDDSLLLSIGTQKAWAVGARLYPVKLARTLENPKITRLSGKDASIDGTFTLVDISDWDTDSVTTYRGYPVLEDSPDSETGQDAEYQRYTSTVDADTNLAIAVDDRAGVGFPQVAHSWWINGASAMAKFRALMYTLKGCQGEIWVPTYQADIRITADVTAGASVLSIEAMDFAVHLDSVQNRRDIRLELMGGTVYYRRVNGASQQDDGTELISLSESLPVDIPSASVRRISFMTLSRLSSDTVEIQHLQDNSGLATCITTFVGVQHDV